MKIIGVTGTNGAGKDVACEHLATKGFLCASLSETLRDEANKRKLPLDRKTLQLLGNQLRKDHGANILADRMITKLRGSERKKIAISSIRNPAEIDELKAAGDFLLLAIDAQIEELEDRIAPAAPICVLVVAGEGIPAIIGGCGDDGSGVPPNVVIIRPDGSTITPTAGLDPN